MHLLFDGSAIEVATLARRGFIAQGPDCGAGLSEIRGHVHLKNDLETTLFFQAIDVIGDVGRKLAQAFGAGLRQNGS